MKHANVVGVIALLVLVTSLVLLLHSCFDSEDDATTPQGGETTSEKDTPVVQYPSEDTLPDTGGVRLDLG